MAHVVPRGMEATGKGVVSDDDLLQIKVVYAEAGFECVSLVLPTGGLAASVQLAMEHGMDEASKKLGLPRKHLHALASGPFVKPDGSPVSIEEWVNNNFIVVKMKQDKKEEGLLGKYRKQHAFLENLMRKGMRELDVSTPNDVPNMPDDLLKEASLKAVERKVIALEAENATMKAEYRTLTDRVTALEAESATTKAENATMKAENATMKAENAAVKVELQMLHKQIAQLSGMDLVMVRKMLEACRTKCRNILSKRNVHIPHDWNALICDAVCIEVLKEAGLTIGLPATSYGKKSQQQKGSEAAHSIMETPEAYATIVCKMDGHQRKQMMNVFEFVFGSRAEDLAFEDIC